MLRSAILLSLALIPLLAPPARAEEFTPIREQARFIALTEGRSLRHTAFGIRLSVTPDGGISGQALGTPVTGNWHWRDGFFCRDMAWGARAIPFNCQLVEARGDQLRFTTDQGRGQSARFRLE